MRWARPDSEGTPWKLRPRGDEEVESRMHIELPEVEGRDGGLWRRHVRLVNGRATMTRAYPQELVKAVLKGIRAQLEEDGEFRDVNALDAGPSPEEDEHLEGYAEDLAPSNEQRTEGQDENILNE